MDKRVHKRFAGFLASVGLLTVGFFSHHPETFASFSTAIGLLYGAYLTGQSATDHKSLHMNAKANDTT